MMTHAGSFDSRRWSTRLMEAALALHENRLDVAERLLKTYLKDDPFDARAIRMLAELAGRIGRLNDAETLLRRAVELAPGFTAARANLALVVGRLGRPAEALALLEDVFAAEPDEIGHSNLKAATLGRLGDFDEAIGLYESVLAKAPRQPRVWLSYGHMLKTVGRQADGIAAYREAIMLKPTLGEAWWSLANLKTVRFSEADTAAMLAALEVPAISDEDRFHLEFALGKAMHDAGEAASAFRHYAAGNALRRSNEPYRAAEITRLVDRSIEAFTAETFQAPSGGAEARDPIFVVGMPRAGSTLVEQILASHPLVEGTSELPDIPALARKRAGYPESILDLTGERSPCARRGLSQAVERPAAHRPPDLHRQAPQQLAVRPLHPPDPAQCEDRRCAATSARLLPFEFPPALRARPGVQLRPHRHGYLLPRLCPADGPRRCRAARTRAPCDL